MPVFNPTTVKQQSFPPLPEGVYLSRIKTIQVHPNPEGEKWTVIHEMLSGPEHDPGEACKRRQIWDTITWSESAGWRVKIFLEALGYDTTTNAEVNYLPDHFHGKQLRVQLFTDDWNGQKRSKITPRGFFSEHHDSGPQPNFVPTPKPGPSVPITETAAEELPF